MYKHDLIIDGIVLIVARLDINPISTTTVFVLVIVLIAARLDINLDLSTIVFKSPRVLIVAKLDINKKREKKDNINCN